MKKNTEEEEMNKWGLGISVKEHERISLEQKLPQTSCCSKQPEPELNGSGALLDQQLPRRSIQTPLIIRKMISTVQSRRNYRS